MKVDTRQTVLKVFCNGFQYFDDILDAAYGRFQSPSKTMLAQNKKTVFSPLWGAVHRRPATTCPQPCGESERFIGINCITMTFFLCQLSSMIGECVKCLRIGEVTYTSFLSPKFLPLLDLNLVIPIDLRFVSGRKAMAPWFALTP
jgi:hypothetical protein